MGLTTTKEWRWDAPGAHTLTAAAGSARILLRDFLLECGWSVIWEDAGAQKVVLRNSMAHGGSGCYARILDDGSFTGGSRVARIDAYEAMTDIDTGSGHATGGYVWKDQTGSGGPNAYTLHGDERTMWVTTYVGGPSPPVSATGASGGHLTCLGGVGDIEPAVAGDPGVFSAFGVTENPGTGSSTGMESGLASINAAAVGSKPTCALSRNEALGLTPTQVGLLVPSSVSTNGIGGTSNSLFGNPSPGFLGQHFVPALLAGGGTIRGRARGLYLPLNDWLSNGGAHVGTTHTPLNMSGGLSLAAMPYSSGSTVGASAPGRLFVARNISWDDL